jgi:hypothetical protein
MKRWERRRADADDDGRDEEVPVAGGDALGRRPRRPPHGGGTIARPHRGPGRSARGGHGGKRILWNSPPPTLMLFFLPLAPTQLFAGLCFFASVSVGVAAFLFAITPPYLVCRGCWRLRHCRCRLRQRWQRRRRQQRMQGCSGWL